VHAILVQALESRRWVERRRIRLLERRWAGREWLWPSRPGEQGDRDERLAPHDPSLVDNVGDIVSPSLRHPIRPKIRWFSDMAVSVDDIDLGQGAHSDHFPLLSLGNAPYFRSPSQNSIHRVLSVSARGQGVNARTPIRNASRSERPYSGKPDTSR
jgi:hypothetical protein